jgi:flavin-dependent dehydrogenase
MKETRTHVAIIGGGPAGSTVGTLLQKYKPTMDVLIIERENFPRDHVGESQLPLVSTVLDEMGVWEKVERAGFPVKIGATYRWGRTEDLWDLEFAPGIQDADMPRPGTFTGVRRNTAFQVDRAIYDEILLNHAEELGCEVMQGARVVEVLRDGDSVKGLVLDSGETVRAKYYVDASGSAGILRRAMGVEVDSPTSLRNIAIWDYWQNAEWAVEIGVGGTRVQVMSLGYGWIWFIPLGPTRTSVGLVIPAEYYKTSGMRPEDLYKKAIAEEPRISGLMREAISEGKLATTKDWSFVADRICGDNWFLAGESAGFADPILAAGMTLAHVGAKECAYTILELDRGQFEPEWLKEGYEEVQKARLRQHIRFADFWYSNNGHFTDLQQYTAQIAKDAGLSLSAKEAFRWLGTGGFANDGMGMASVATFSITPLKEVAKRFTCDDPGWELNDHNVFRLNLEDAEVRHVGVLENGTIRRAKCYIRDGKTLSLVGVYWYLFKALQKASGLEDIFAELNKHFTGMAGRTPRERMGFALEALETMTIDGWVVGELDPNRPKPDLRVDDDSKMIHANRDAEMPNARVPEALRSGVRVAAE